jgi:hypothetical protein
MLEERRRILNMLAEGKISVADADGLLTALSDTKALPAIEAAPEAPKSPRYLRVQVEDNEGDKSKVNIRVPFSLLRAGVRLTALLPSSLHDRINQALRDKGVDIDISKLKPDNLEELVVHLAELTVDVDGGNGDRVRVYCE